ncbi:bifunctional metallophosphatase/5'-nucleotidase [Acholeplasma laidlawii]|uniref:bifunctional metallophosphatase/5'-nucleotidase n=1 Tax=Acholeplasma laidlawii TaxID=2148 RepID=UPI00084CE106|nr:bifunctional UDP-sugar hydrolase/5'-nucleotidase [Acholeplasma laidlawii]OED59372.1 hypothetical protein BHS12_03425 [Acholeplasma laidlawii]
MKKIMSFIVLSLVLILISCQTLGDSPGEDTIIFEVADDIEYVIGEERPIYLEYVTAKDINNITFIQFVTYDDSLVNYEVEGEYQVTFELDYEDYHKAITVDVRVVSTSTTVNLDLNIFYINDFHGAVLNNEEQIGLSRIGNLIMDEKNNNPDTTLFLAGGDILQGQLISNWYDGASTIELLNDMELDAFVAGNHEFDWGVDVLTQYFNGQNDLQANFPLLGANVYEKSSNEMVEGFEPYTIIEKSGVKIAVIGTVGYGLESSIAYARIKDYKFIDPVERVMYFAHKARTEDGADIVIAINHADDDGFNNSIANLKGDYKVDAIFNGHTHRYYTRTINNVPVMQSGANGSHVGHVTLNYDSKQGVYKFTQANLTQFTEERLNVEQSSIKFKIDNFYNEISGLYDPIMVSSEGIDKGLLSNYIGKLMQTKFGADVGLHNAGGTRDTIRNGECLSYAKLHAISPFDNTVVLIDVTGEELLDAIGGENAYFRTGLSMNDIQMQSTYKLALNDYIFGSKWFLRDKPAVFTGVTVLDLFVETVENQSSVYETWTSTLPIMFNQNVSLFAHLITYSSQIHM